MANVNFLDPNQSYAERCRTYAAVECELVPGDKNKNEYIRFSLKRIKKDGRIDALCFSHYFNVGISDMVKEYKRLGVSKDGISDENLVKAKEEYDDATTDCEVTSIGKKNYFTFCGFFYVQSLGGVYKNKTTNKVSSETMYFVVCDEDGFPKPEFLMTASRLEEIKKGYEPVNQSFAEEASVAEEQNPSGLTPEQQKLFEQFKAAQDG